MRKAPGIIKHFHKLSSKRPSGFKCNCGRDIPQGAINCGTGCRWKKKARVCPQDCAGRCDC